MQERQPAGLRNYAAWLNKGCNSFARNTLYLLDVSGFRLELIPATESDGGEAIKAAGMSRATQMRSASS